MPAEVTKVAISTIHEPDKLAEAIISRARTLIAGGETHGAFLGRVEIECKYFPKVHDPMGYNPPQPGQWVAAVPVEPQGRRNRMAIANGASPHGAVQRLLQVVNDIPVVSWSDSAPPVPPAEHGEGENDG